MGGREGPPVEKSPGIEKPQNNKRQEDKNHHPAQRHREAGAPSRLEGTIRLG